MAAYFACEHPKDVRPTEREEKEKKPTLMLTKDPLEPCETEREKREAPLLFSRFRHKLCPA